MRTRIKGCQEREKPERRIAVNMCLLSRLSQTFADPKRDNSFTFSLLPHVYRGQTNMATNNQERLTMVDVVSALALGAKVVRSLLSVALRAVLRDEKRESSKAIYFAQLHKICQSG